MEPNTRVCARCRGRAGILLALLSLLPLVASAGAWGDEQDKGKPKSKSVGGFGESWRGDVPEGTLEMLTPETDRAIQTGLTWLARSQNADGSFGSGTYRGNIAVTSLAGLAFMSGGSSPGRGPYGVQIEKALAYVMENTSPSGFIAVASSSTHGPMYSHGFGALFLAEAYGMTHRPEIREKLQKAVRLIIDTQNNEGGWRYQPLRRDADLSVTICQINALRQPGTPDCTYPGKPSRPVLNTSSTHKTPMAASGTCFREVPARFHARPRASWRFRAQASTTTRKSRMEWLT